MTAQSFDPPDFLHPPSGLGRKVAMVIAILLMGAAIAAICIAAYYGLEGLSHALGIFD